MPEASIDDWVTRSAVFPPLMHEAAACVAAKADIGGTTPFNAILIDSVNGIPVTECWNITHSVSLAPSDITNLERYWNSQTIVERGAIAVLATILEARSCLALHMVEKIGNRSDYTLTDQNGVLAGVIECKGLSSERTSQVAASARANVRQSPYTPQRIGVVAFGGPEIRIEVVG